MVSEVDSLLVKDEVNVDVASLRSDAGVDSMVDMSCSSLEVVSP